MIPTLNLLPESAAGSGGPAAVAPATDVAQTAELPAAGSFAAILTDQGSAPLPPGGNPLHPGGKALPLLAGMEIDQDVLDAADPAAVTAPDAADFILAVASAEPAPGTAWVPPAGAWSDVTQEAAPGGKPITVAATEQTAVDAIAALDAITAPDAIAAADAVAAADAIDAVAADDAAAALATGVSKVVAAERKFAGVTAEPDTIVPPGPVILPPVRPDVTPVDMPRQVTVSRDAATDAALVRQEPGQGIQRTPAPLGDVSVIQEFADLPEATQARTPGSPSLAPLVGPAGSALSTAEATPAAGPRPELMSKPPGDPGWGNEFVGRVSLMIKNGSNEARLQLNPAELGQLDIKITTEGDRAVILFTVQHGAAREAIDLAMPRLREMLEQSGLQLAHSEVADHSQSERGSDGNAGEWDTGDLGAASDSDQAADDGEESRYHVALPDTATVDYYA